MATIIVVSVDIFRTRDDAESLLCRLKTALRKEVRHFRKVKV